MLKQSKAMQNNTTFPPPEDLFIIHKIYFASSIIILCLSPVAVVGNALILAAIWRKTFLRTSFHILLSGLALTDLCTGLIAQPLVAVIALLLISYPKDERSVLLAIKKATIDGVVIYSLNLTLFLATLLSVERWLHMSRQNAASFRRRCLTAIFVLLLPIPLALLHSLDSTNKTFGRELKIILLAVKICCISITSFAYCKIFRIIRHHQQQVQANVPPQNFGQPAINLAKYKKSVVTILYILALSYFCFLPFIVSVGTYLHVDSNDSKVIEVSLYVCLALVFLSSSLNPCLYLWRMNDVRNGVKQLFCSNS